MLSSWSLEITDDQGKVQRFGPSTREQESISGNAILGDRSQGDYKVVMLGDTKGGKFVQQGKSGPPGPQRSTDERSSDASEFSLISINQRLSRATKSSLRILSHRKSRIAAGLLYTVIRISLEMKCTTKIYPSSGLRLYRA